MVDQEIPDQVSLDARRTPVRGDIAARHLEGEVDAERFVEGEELEVYDPILPVRREPSHGAALDTEALKGERVMIYDRTVEGWAWGQLLRDGYVGWLPDAALVRPRTTPTHKIAALRTFAFPGPSIKLPPVETLPLGAQLEITREHDAFAITVQQHFIPLAHIAPLDAFERDFVAVAERFVGTPYLWGGRTSLGVDCSGLVQTALAACGIEAPRDSDMQEAELGDALTEVELDYLARGDLIFWKGHVAIVRDNDTILHANAFHMAVTIEETSEALQRIQKSAGKITKVKRLFDPPIDPAFIG
jgi:cell wall-associated NlpC family hydrolase